MYKEWDNPAPNVDMPSLRAYVKDLHDNIVSAGTGCTQVVSQTEQFDFVSEVVTMFSRIYSNPSKPLIYKYSSTGNKDLYIKIHFYIGEYGRYSGPHIITKIGIWDSLYECNNNMTYSNKLINTYTSNYRSIGDSNVQRSPSRSFISNNDGVLTIVGSHGYTTNNYRDYKKAVVFIHVEATPYGYVRLYERNNESYLYHTTSDISSTYFLPEVLLVHNKTASISRVSYCNVDNRQFTAIFPLMYINEVGILTRFKNTYYYNRIINSSMGILSVDSINLWMAGSQLRYWDLLKNDAASLAIEVI